MHTFLYFLFVSWLASEIKFSILKYYIILVIYYIYEHLTKEEESKRGGVYMLTVYGIEISKQIINCLDPESEVDICIW